MQTAAQGGFAAGVGNPPSHSHGGNGDGSPVDRIVKVHGCIVRGVISCIRLHVHPFVKGSPDVIGNALVNMWAALIEVDQLLLTPSV